MKNSELIRILKQFPEDLEITFSVSGDYSLELESVEDIARLTDGEHKEVEICLKSTDTAKTLTKEEIEGICYGRDDLLSTAEQICCESELSAADGEVLCMELARTAIDYLNWVNKPVTR